MRKLAYAAVAALALYSTAASATATFDTATGVGTIPHGDVEAAFGLSAAGLADSLINYGWRSAYYEDTATYYVTCEWDQQFGSRTIHRRSGYSVSGVVKRYMFGTTSVTAGVSADDFHLTGYNGVTQGSVSLPEIGDQCGPYGRGGGEALVTDVSPVAGTGTGTLHIELVQYGDRAISFVAP